MHYEGVHWDPRYPQTTDVVSRMYAPAAEIEEFLATHRDKPYVLCEYAHSMGNSFGAVHKYVDLAYREPLFQGGFIWVPGARITLLEKEDGVGRHQTGHNSGVLHCGLYYKPGSVKARLAVQRHPADGRRSAGRTASRTRSAASWWWRPTTSEVPRLRDLHERGTANGLEGLRWLDRDEMREIEPHVGGVAALRVPQEGIVDYPKVCEALVAKLRRAAPAWSPARASTALRQTAPAGSRRPRAGEFEPAIS